MLSGKHDLKHGIAGYSQRMRECMHRIGALRGPDAPYSLAALPGVPDWLVEPGLADFLMDSRETDLQAVDLRVQGVRIELVRLDAPHAAAHFAYGF